jgi:hypothetical protein
MQSVYEFFVNLRGARRPVRIELFKSIDSDLFRGRVWISGIFNLYPSAINTDNAGNDLRSLHSAEELSIELSALIADDEQYVYGKRCETEREVLDYFVKMVDRYVRSITAD